MIHELKTHPAYFARVADGTKTFEVRRNDRAVQPGDVLLLQEYDPTGDHDRCSDSNCTTARYTGAQIQRKVGFVASGTLFGLELGEHVVLPLLPVNHADPEVLPGPWVVSSPAPVGTPIGVEVRPDGGVRVTTQPDLDPTAGKAGA